MFQVAEEVVRLQRQGLEERGRREGRGGEGRRGERGKGGEEKRKKKNSFFLCWSRGLTVAYVTFVTL